MLRRKAYDQMLFWKQHKTKQALLVKGARQIGKTFLVRQFLSENYPSYIEINFMDDDAARESCAAARNAEDLMLRLSVAASSVLTAGETAIFLDEVQECPSIMRLLKKLVDLGRYDFVLSGSLLGIGLEGVDTYPGGYVTELEMHPLDFEEFCWSQGVGDAAWDVVRSSVERVQSVPDFIHERLLALYHRYILVGGMPDAVVAFTRDDGIDQARSVQTELIRLYKRDIAQYAPKDKRLVIQNIYDLIPSEITGTSKRFRFSSIENVKKFDRVADEFLWLTRAGVASAAYCVSDLHSPLLISKQDSKFKLYLSDVGMLTSTFPKRSTLGLLDGKAQANMGGVYESAVMQELVAHGPRPYYYASKSIGEIDFVLEGEKGTVLIEVKSGSSYRTHAALDHACERLGSEVQAALVLGETNIERDGRVTYLPVYTAGLL